MVTSLAKVIRIFIVSDIRNRQGDHKLCRQKHVMLGIFIMSDIRNRPIDALGKRIAAQIFATQI